MRIAHARGAVVAVLLAAGACGDAQRAGSAAAEIEVVVGAPDGGAPSGGFAAFFPDESSGERSYWEDPLDERGRAVLRPRVGVTGRVFVLARDLTSWESQPLVAAPGRTRIDVATTAGLSVEGVVVGRDGTTPVPGTTIRVTERVLRDVRAGLGMRTVTSGPDGRFRAAGLAPGSVRLDALHAGEPADVGTHAVEVVDAGARGVRLMLSRTIRVQLLPVDAATGRGLATPSVELEQQFEDGQWVCRHFDPWRRTEPSPEPFVIPRTPLSVSGREIARYRIRATGYRDSRVVEVDPNRGSAEQTIRVELTPDPFSVARYELRVATEDGDVPRAIFVLLRSSDGSRERGRVFHATGGRAEIEVPPGVASLRVEGRFGGRGLDRPWLPVDLVLHAPSGAVGTREIVLPAGGFLRAPGETDPWRLPSQLFRTGADGADPLWLHWDRDRDTASCTSLPLPPGDYEINWWSGTGTGWDEGTWTTETLTIRPREVTEIRRPAE